MTLQEIVEQNAEFVKNSGYSININRRLQWVHIQHESGDEDLSIFLQGADAEQFINEYDNLADQPSLDHVYLGDLQLATAKPYIESLI
jgi:uncharacterized protein with von Willebrand factor type A (vWA) domain